MLGSSPSAGGRRRKPLLRACLGGLGSLLVCLVLLAVLALPSFHPAIAQTSGGAQKQPPAVTVVAVAFQSVAQSFDFIGRVEAIQAVDLRARVDGFVREVAFREGQAVAEGDVLFRIEPDEYEADLQAAEAELARAQASLRRAERDLERGQKLLERGNISQASVDQSLAERDTALADIETAKARIRQAQLNLDYTTIEAPIAGRIGEALYTKGNLVSPDSGPLARIVQLDPIRVVFSVTDRAMLWARQHTGAQTLEELQARFIPALRLADDSAYPHEGEITFTDNEMDPSTGTLAVYTRFPNPKQTLLPGQLVTVVSRLAEEKRLAVVPQPAIQRDRDGAYVLVVDPENRVQRRRVTLGDQVDTGWAVESGLREGELVIVQGVQKVSPGIVAKPVFEDGADSRAQSDADRPAAQ